MTRILGLVVLALAVIVATMQPSPEPPVAAVGVTSTPEAPAGGSSHFAHCPWSRADSVRSSAYSVLGEGPADFDLSYLEGGAVEDRISGRIDTDTAVRVDNQRQVGASSALIEFSGGAGTVGVGTTGGSLLAGDLCSGTIPGAWHLPGGSTLEGESLVLRLFNPFTADARVDLWAFSELGIEAVEAIEGLTVPARRTRVVALEELLPRRESLSIIVRPVLGSVVPVMVLDTGTDLAVWPGSGAADGWEFPVAGAVGYRSDLVLTNEASIPVNFLVEAFDESGAPLPTQAGRIEGPGQARVSLEDLSSSGFGVRVSGDGPFGAAVLARSETGVAATVGARTTATGWLVPGPGIVTAGSRLRFLNAGVTELTVTYRTLTPQGRTRANTIGIPPTSVHTVHIADPEVAGVRVTSDGPLTVGWLAAVSGGAMFSGAIPSG